MQDKVALFRDFLFRASNLNDEEKLDSLAKNYQEKLGVTPDSEMYELWNEVLFLVKENMFLKANGASASRSKKLAALTDEEKATLAEVEEVINENRFGYHFQPIVNATDGSIYSFEALMRPQSNKMKLAPYHVLKYAELMGRLNDIERATFLNVLNTIDTQRELFGDRKVFINSIPKTKLDSEDFHSMSELMMKHSDTVVVELTENAEFNEDELRSLQERYRNWDIKIALDDYGTGYSNVQNLLRYSPNYVKIDRALLTEIQNSPKKKHFVREIIEFCHDNNIMALAEGVETSEELHTVILLGADLIQGYYTSRPSAEILDAIPYEIRQEITLYQQERQDGKDQQVYAAESTERVLLDKLKRDDFQCILVGKDSAEDGEVSIVGAASLDTEIHIEVAQGFRGKLVLQNAHLSNVKNRPCINLGENSDVTLELAGENRLSGGGIRVPEGARLTVRGDGKLEINVEAAEYYAIGNDISSAHGDISFEHIGMVSIRVRGKTGVCIGSGLGGNTTIAQGKIILNANGNTGVGIGSLYGDVDLKMSSCSVDADMSLMNGVAVGSLTGNASVYIQKCSSRFNMSGRDLSAVGTIGGDSADIHINGAFMTVGISGYHCTGVGSLNKKTTFKVENGAFRATVAGETALAFGGFSKDTTASFLNSDSSIDLNSKNDPTEYISFDRIENVGGRTSVIVNGHEIDIRALEKN